MGHPQPLPAYSMYESRPVYHGMSPPISAPLLQGPPQFLPYAAVPTQRYGYTQRYQPPMMRNNHEHHRSHHYGRNNSSFAPGSGGRGRHGYQPSENNHNARYSRGNVPAFNGPYTSHHHGHRSQNFQSARAANNQQDFQSARAANHQQDFQPARAANQQVHQGWVTRNNAGGPIEQHGHPQQPVNQYSVLDRRENR